MYPSLDELFELIKQWGEEKGINSKENVNRQFLKLVEETGELAAGLAKLNEEKTVDAMGDVFVVWVILCEQLGYNPREIVYNVYNIINERTGKTVDGVFIKDEDIVDQ